MLMTPTGDHYRVLGVSPTATTPEIRRAYRRLARRHHPDRNPGPDGAERFRALAASYAVLSDPVRRAAYDHGIQPRGRDGPPGAASPVPVRRGVLELSAREARLAAATALVLAVPSANPMTFALPAGVADGDEIAISTPAGPVILTVRVAPAPKT